MNNKKKTLTIIGLIAVALLAIGAILVIPRIAQIREAIAPTAPKESEAAKWQTDPSRCVVGFSVPAGEATDSAVPCDEGFKDTFSARQLDRTKWDFVGSLVMSSGSANLTAAQIKGNEKKGIPSKVEGLSGYVAGLLTKDFYLDDIETSIDVLSAKGRVAKQVEGDMTLGLSLYKDENNHVDIRYSKKAGVATVDVWLKKAEGNVDKIVGAKTVDVNGKPNLKLVRQDGKFKAYVNEGSGFVELVTDDSFVLDDWAKVMVYVNADGAAKANVGNFYAGCIGGTVVTTPTGTPTPTPTPTVTPTPTATPNPTSTPTPTVTIKPTNTPAAVSTSTPTPTTALSAATPTATPTTALLAEGVGGTQTAVKTPTPTKTVLPEAGIGLPTIGALGGGIVMILLGILLAL